MVDGQALTVTALIMPPVIYREFQPDDLNAVAAIWTMAYRLVGVIGASPLNTLGSARERILHGLPGWHLRVAQEDQRLIGFMATIPARCVLEHLYVAPPAIGRGIGTGLLRLAMSEMPDGFWLRVSAENKAGRRFFERRGLRLDHEEAHSEGGRLMATCGWVPGAE